MEETTGTTPSITENKSTKQDNRVVYSFTAAIVGIILAIAALVISFAGNKSSGKEIAGPANSGDLKIVWVNTDTIWEKYDFVKDVKADLDTFEKNLQSHYNASLAAFQNEYNAYIKKASAYQLSLDEQKKTEEKLGKKQQELQELDAQLSQKLIDEKTARNMEVHDTIVNYIHRFNMDKKYTFIMERSYGGGLLWADPSLEITDEIIKGLNKEYVSVKKERESAGK